MIFYISAHGNDRHDGRAPDPAEGGRGPFATLTRARDAIRAARRAGQSGPFAVELRGGIHYLTEPFTLEPEDSGTAEAPVVYRAFAGEQPVISGGVRLTGFQTTAVNGVEGWVADLPEAMRFTQLFVNGQRMARTRLPETGLFRIADCEVLSPHELLDWYGRITRFVYHEGDLDPAWRNLSDVHIVFLKRWFDSHAHLAGLDGATRTATLDAHIIEGGVDCTGQFASYGVENVFEALRHPGQFCLDRPARKLYYIPRFGDKPDTAEVIAPRLQTLVCVAGDPWGKKVRHVRFEHLDFRHAEYRYPAGDPGAVQAAFTLPGAITLRGAEDCVFYGCTVAQVAQYAIEFRLGCTHNAVIACHLHDLGGGGVKINHDRGTATPAHEDAVRLRPDPDAGVWVPPDADVAVLPRQKVTVSDCLIHDGGILFPSAVGVWIGDSAGNRIVHNEIWNLNYSGISCGWTWVHQFDVHAADNLIAGNHIHHLNPRGLLSDLAGIYILGANPGTVVRGNLVHDVATAFYGNWGIYFDGSCSFVHAEGNAAFRCGYGGFFSNVGRQNSLLRNIFINDTSPDNPALVVGHDGGTHTLTAVDNVLVSGAPQVLLNDTYQGHVRFQNNHYANRLGVFGFAARPFIGTMLSPDEWRARGYGADEHMLAAAPTGTNAGLMRLPDQPPFNTPDWVEVLKALRAAGPRVRDLVPRDYAQAPRDPDVPRPVLLPILEINREMFADARHERYVDRLHVPPGTAVAGTLRLINRGEIPVHGPVRIAFETPAHGRVEGAAETVIDLPPGAETTLHFHVTLAPTIPRAQLQAHLPPNTSFAPVGLYLYPE